MSELSELASEFTRVNNGKEPKAPREFGGPIPDAYYKVFIQKALWSESKKGTKFLSWHLKIMEGSFSGRVLFKDSYLSIDNPVGFEILGEDLRLIFGNNIPALDDPKLLDKLLDKELLIKKQTRTDNEPGQDYYRVYINGCEDAVARIGDQESTKAPQPEEEPPLNFQEDDIPF
jgi:hypothetical protein